MSDITETNITTEPNITTIISGYYNKKEFETITIYGRCIKQTTKTITMDYEYVTEYVGDGKSNKYNVLYDDSKHKYYYIKYIGDTLKSKKIYIPKTLRKNDIYNITFI